MKLTLSSERMTSLQEQYSSHDCEQNKEGEWFGGLRVTRCANKDVASGAAYATDTRMHKEHDVELLGYSVTECLPNTVYRTPILVIRNNLTNK